MNYPAVNHWVSINDDIYLTAASCGEFNPTDFATSYRTFIVICGLN